MDGKKKYIEMCSSFTEPFNWHEPGTAWVHSLFALTVCLEVTLQCNFWVDSRKSLYFNHAINADMSGNWNWK